MSLSSFLETVRAVYAADEAEQAATARAAARPDALRRYRVVIRDSLNNTAVTHTALTSPHVSRRGIPPLAR